MQNYLQQGRLALQFQCSNGNCLPLHCRYNIVWTYVLTLRSSDIFSDAYKTWQQKGLRVEACQLLQLIIKRIKRFCVCEMEL